MMKRQYLGVVAVVATLLLAGAAIPFSGAAATSTATTTATSTATDAPGELANETLAVSEDSEGIQVVAENTSGNLTVTVYGVDSDGNETQVTTATLSAAENETDTFRFYDLNATKYPEYRVVVEGDGAETVDVAVLEAVSGGGLLAGGVSDVDPMTAAGVVVLAGLAGAAVWFNRQ